MTKAGEARRYFDDVVIPYRGDECLFWPFARTHSYATISINGRQSIISRLLCEANYGAPPSSDHEAAHSCGRGMMGCVAQSHIRWKTPTLRPLSDYLANATDAVARGTVGGYRNLLRRNGGFEIWQRGISIISTGAYQALYGADGWYFSGQPLMAFQQNTGHVNGSQYSGRITRLSGETGTAGLIVGFPLDTDEIYPMLGQFVRLSFTIVRGTNWTSAAGAMQISLSCGTATPGKVASGYTSQTSPISQVINLTGTVTPYQINSSVVVPLTTRQAEVSFTWTPVGTAGTDESFSIDDVQLEVVPAATGYVSSDFERLNFQEQLLLCQRHYWKTFNYSVAPAQNVGTSFGEQIWTQASAASVLQISPGFNFPVPMRTVPSIATYNPQAANNQIRNPNVAADCSGLASYTTNTRTASVQYANAVGSAVGQAAILHATFDAGI